MPFFAYRKGSGLGTAMREARRVAGAPLRDATRFVAQARTLEQTAEVKYKLEVSTGAHAREDCRGGNDGGFARGTDPLWQLSDSSLGGRLCSAGSIRLLLTSSPWWTTVLSQAPSIVANDLCDIMGESVGATHKNTCDEWREQVSKQARVST